MWRNSNREMVHIIGLTRDLRLARALEGCWAVIECAVRAGRFATAKVSKGGVWLIDIWESEGGPL